MRMLLIPLFLFISLQSLAGSTLLIPKEFYPIAINGKRLNTNIQSRSLALNHGLNNVAFQYRALFNSSSKNNKEQAVSDIYILSFRAKNNTRYSVQYLKPSNLQSALKFAMNPSVNIKRIDGSYLITKQHRAKPPQQISIAQQTKIKLKKPELLNIVSGKEKEQ